MTYIIKVPEMSPNNKVIRNKSIDIYEATQVGVDHHKRALYASTTMHTLTPKGFKHKAIDLPNITDCDWRDGARIATYSTFQEAHDAKIKQLKEVQQVFYDHIDTMIAKVAKGIHPTAILERT